MRVLVLVGCLAVSAAACSSSNEPGQLEAVPGSSTTTSTALAHAAPEVTSAPTTIETLTEPAHGGLDALPTCGSGLVGFELDSPLSEVGWIADAQIDRASVGLPSTAAVVLEIAQGFDAEYLVGTGVRTPHEHDTVAAAFAAASSATLRNTALLAEIITEYSPGQNQPLTPAGSGRYAVPYTDHDAARIGSLVRDANTELDTAGIDLEVVAVRVEHSIEELEHTAQLLASRLPRWWVRTDHRLNAVTVDLGLAEPSDSDRWPFQEPPPGVCLSTSDGPGDFGPQPSTGEGWRLLAITDSQAPGGWGPVPYAVTPIQLDSLWRDLEIPDDPPVIDFDHEIVAVFFETRGFPPACHRVFFAGVDFTADSVAGQPRNVGPLNGGGCLAIGLPRSFVVALSRDHLPDSPFTLQRDTEPWSHNLNREQHTINITPIAGWDGRAQNHLVPHGKTVRDQVFCERMTGFEPATSTLARLAGQMHRAA